MTGGGSGVPGGWGGGFKRRGALRRRGVKRDTGAHGVEGGLVTCFLHQGEAGYYIKRKSAFQEVNTKG